MIYIYTIAGMTSDDCHLKQVGIGITDKGIEISKDNKNKIFTRSVAFNYIKK